VYVRANDIDTFTSPHRRKASSFVIAFLHNFSAVA
jgi:hypothetical protein